MEQVLEMLAPATVIDLLALVIFACCWVGYRYFAETGSRRENGLVGVMHEYRLQWAIESTSREIPVACASLIGNLMNSVSFYASTTIYIIAGLFALVGTVDQLEVFTVDIPFAAESSRALIEVKLLLLVFIFIAAYFKFTWSLRQFNFLCILVGGVPHKSNTPDEEYCETWAQRTARMNSLAGNEFNRGVRAYYYGIAALAWFINPWMFICSTLWITFLLYRRDFHSKTLAVVRDTYPLKKKKES